MTEDHSEFDFDSVDWNKLEQESASTMGPTIVPISPEMLAKMLVWDTVPCDHAVEVGNFLGLPSASDEVEKMEHDESHHRLLAARLVAPYVNLMSGHASRAIVGSMIVGHGEAEHADRSDVADAASKLEAVIFQASYSIIAELLDTGYLRYPDGVVFFGGVE